MKPYLPLFQNKKEVVFTTLTLVAIFLISIFWTYLDFREFKSRSWATIRGEISNIVRLNAKDGREYKRLYVKTDDSFTVSIAYFAKDEFAQNARVGFRVKTADVDFVSFLARKFYASAVLVWKYNAENIGFKTKLQNAIKNQHENVYIQELYGALFLATPISKVLRDKVQVWGIAHIIAISGFHLGVIFGFLYAVLAPMYRFFQNRYFPYRNLRWDISLAIFAFLGFYLWHIDMTPSFLRAYVMGVFGFLFLWRGINVLSFEILALTTGLLIAFFPYLMFNIGFVLSVVGVFFIFVFIKHFGAVLKNWQIAILINFWLFFAMNPIVHYWFGVINFQQWVSIPLSLAFVLFFPLVIFLHFIGFGAVFDEYILSFLFYETPSGMLNTPIWLLVIYIFCSFMCAYRAIFMIPVALLGIGYFFLF